MAINSGGPHGQNMSSESPAAGLPLDKLAKLLPRDQIDELDVVIDDNGEVVFNQDGSADFVVDDDQGDVSGVEFNANLAEHLDEEEMEALASDLKRKIDADKTSRENRDKQYEEGIRRTGMGNDAPGGADFKGASRVVHPMLVEACVDFCAAAIKELLPPSGPVKTKSEGRNDPKKYAVSQRQQRYLNWQLQEQISEFAAEVEQLLTQLPMGGSQYLKFWRDGTLRRVACEFVPIDDLYLPYACSDFYSAQRITHVQRLTQHVFEERVESEFYRDIDEAPAPSTTPDDSKASTANDKVEGRSQNQDNVDGERNVFEVNTYAKLSIDGEEKLPYLISIDETSGKIVAIYRNWDKQDESRARLDWIVEFGFIAWRGAYKIGMPHLIGGLSAAATGALRALLDSAHFNNMPGFLRLKGARVGGQTKEINPASGVEVEGSVAVDDIRKLVMALPYNQPSAVLFQLLGWLDEAAKGVVTTAEEKIADASNQMPVGTALALIESGAKVYSSIHGRLHRSMTRAFRILARLNKKHLSIAEQLTNLGEVLATRNDFAEPLGVIPVSDPNIFSEAQRFAQMQMVLGLAQGVDPKTGEPTATAKLHNLYESLKRLYEIAKIPDFDRLLPPPPHPEELNAAAENMASLMSRPIMAFAPQDHFAHIETHMRFITDPFLGGSGMAAQNTMPMMMEHVKQHLGYLYLELLGQVVQRATGEKIEVLMQDKGGQAFLDRVIAMASKIVHGLLQQRLAPLGGVITSVLKQIAEMQMPQAMDPAQAMIMAEKIRAQGRAAEIDKKERAATERQAGELQSKDRQHQDKIELERDKLAVNGTLKAEELGVRIDMHGATLEQQDEQDRRRVLHEAAQNDATRQDQAEERAHQAQLDEAGRAHEADQAARQRASQFLEGDAKRAHEAQQGAAQRGFQSNQDAANRAHEVSQGERERIHQASQAAAERAQSSDQHSSQLKQQAKELDAKLRDGKEARKQQAQIEDKKIKASAAKAKPPAKPKGKPK